MRSACGILFIRSLCLAAAISHGRPSLRSTKTQSSRVTVLFGYVIKLASKQQHVERGSEILGESTGNTEQIKVDMIALCNSMVANLLNCVRIIVPRKLRYTF